MADAPLNQLAKRVKAMRDAQKLYFRRRMPRDLEIAKEWERVVDAQVEQILAPPQTRSLFEEQTN